MHERLVGHGPQVNIKIKLRKLLQFAITANPENWTEYAVLFG